MTTQLANRLTHLSQCLCYLHIYARPQFDPDKVVLTATCKQRHIVLWKKKVVFYIFFSQFLLQIYVVGTYTASRHTVFVLRLLLLSRHQCNTPYIMVNGGLHKTILSYTFFMIFMYTTNVLDAKTTAKSCVTFPAALERSFLM